MAFIGQDFVATDYLIGKRMIEEHGLSEGDLVFTPVDSPDAVYAQLRQKGVDLAMQEVGAQTEILGTGFNESGILDAQTQYLIGHPDVKAIIGIGLPQVEMAILAAKPNLNSEIGHKRNAFRKTLWFQYPYYESEIVWC